MSNLPNNCPACGEKMKVGVFSSNYFISSNKIAVINEFHSEKISKFCSKCGDPLYAKYKKVLIEEKEMLFTKLKSNISSIPIVSLHTPLNWIYSVLGIVTAQSTTGTGVFSDFTSSFTDFFGAQSKTYNRKLKAGEDICKDILRAETLNSGGNAILATDIDYAEVGGESGMLMVCMTGTAVVLKNPEILEKNIEKSLTVLSQVKERLEYLTKFNISFI